MWIFKICVPSLLMAMLVTADGGRHRHGRNHRHGRQGRQNNEASEAVPGGVDFSGCEMQDDGMCCVMREEEITTLAKDPILECTHKDVEKCHYTYVTEFTPAQEEICEENFEKKCQITFKQMAVTETVQKCYRPLMKTCGNEATPSRLRRYKRQLPGYGDDGRGDSLADPTNEQCKTFYESACTTKYVEKQPGKFVGDTSCEKLPVELCGQGCTVEEGEEECHDKEIDTLIDVPEEVCDLNPQKTCRFQTKLVPKLKPTHECTVIPQEICQLKFTSPREESKPFMSKWCIDPNAEPVPDQTYDDSDSPPPLGPQDDPPPETDSERQPDALYGAPGQDFSDEDFEIPPPPSDEAFEQAASSYEEPVIQGSPLNTNYGVPSDAGYGAPRSGRQRQGRRNNGFGNGRRNNRFGGPSRRNGRRGGQRQRSGRQQEQPENPSTLYGAPSLPEYASDLPSYGLQDELPSYGNRRSSASNLVPVYVPSGRQQNYNSYYV